MKLIVLLTLSAPLVQPQGRGTPEAEAAANGAEYSSRPICVAGADPETNLRLSGGEEVRVPEAGKVFVVGNVKRPGAFPVEDGAETSVLRMLARAEGLAPFAGKLAYIYRRETPGSKYEIPIALHKIVLRKAPDSPLRANDVLYIPDNRNHRLGRAILERLLLFDGTAGATALVYGSR